MSPEYRIAPYTGIQKFIKWKLQKYYLFSGWIDHNWYVTKEAALADLERLNTPPIYYVPKGKQL